MSFNKTKAKRNAERYLTQGKIQAAINEYRQIVDNDPKDINTQNMLGDLYVKANNDQEAVKCYARVAEFYNKQGFAKKAIAIYNKIYRIVPASTEISSKLAELYRLRGSYAEAKKHYEKLAAHYEEKGQRIEALAIWENIAELDPRNAEIYLKIAESYWQDDRADEASKAFVMAGQRLAAASNHESAVTAYSRALEIMPLDFEAMEGLVRSQIDLGYPEEAAKILAQRIESDPYDRETNFLLVDCYYDMDDPASAERIIVKMVERDPSNYRKFLDLIDVYLKLDDLDSSVRVLSMITEHMLVGGEHEALLALLEEILARNPEHLSALRLLTRYHSWLKDETELKNALERVVESARINNSEDDEQYALSQLTLLVPHDKEIADRLAELGGISDEFEGYYPAVAANAGEEVPNFQSYAVLSDDSDKAENGFKTGENGYAETSEEAGAGNGYEIQDPTGSDVGSDTGETLEAEIVSETEERADVEYHSPDAIHTEHSDIPGVTADANEESDQSVADSEPGPCPKLNAADEMRLEDELESVRFYLDQGYNGLADKSISEMEREFGNRPEISELRAALGGVSRAAVVENGRPEAPEMNSVASEVAESGGDESTNSEEENIESAEFAEGEDAKTEPDGAEVQNSPETAVGRETVNEANADQHAADDPGRKNKNSFENFRDDLDLGDAETEADDGYEDHYHHAVAYQEMGLMDEAIREFQDAVSKVSPNDGTRRFLNCCTLLGHCFMEKGMPNLSIVWFKRAFEATGLTNDELNGLNYELANAYEADGETEEAIAAFEEIYAVDLDFRDVGERIEKLLQLAPAST